MIPPIANDPTYKPLFRFWNQLSEQEQEELIKQIEQIDYPLLKKQQQLLFEKVAPQYKFEPFSDYVYSGNPQDCLEGFKRIQAGELGCLVLAGGQGTRLRYEPPKGTYPVSL